MASQKPQYVTVKETATPSKPAPDSTTVTKVAAENKPIAQLN